MKRLFSLSLLLAIAIAPVSKPAFAHHAGANYDRNNVSEIEGVVSAISWRNPHVTMKLVVTTKQGDEQTWKIESGPLNTMRRLGVSRSHIAVGDSIRLSGATERQGKPAMFAFNALLADGRELRLSPTNDYVWTTDGATPVESVAAEQPDQVNTNLFDIWSRILGTDAVWDIPMNERAKALQAGWDAQRDDKSLRCVPPGMVEIMVTPFPIKLTQNAETVEIQTEIWDSVRQVWPSSKAAAGKGLGTPLGQSVFSWDGDTFVVTTTGSSFAYLNDEGLPKSLDAVIVERFTLKNDGRAMDWIATVTDPQYLAAPATVSQQYEWTPNEAIQEFNCQMPEE